MSRFLDMFLENFKSRRFVAVDLDGRFLRMVHAEQSNHEARVLRMAVTELPESLDIADAAAVGQLLGEALKKNKMGGEPLLMNVPRGQAVLKAISLPAQVGRDELAAMVQYQVEKELPFRPEEAVIDFTVDNHAHAIARPADGGTSVLVAAVRLPVIEHFRRVAASAGAKLMRLGLRPYANIRCLSACGITQDTEGTAMVYVGSEETEIDILFGESLAFSRSTAVKISVGNSDTHAESLNMLIAEIVRTIQSYQTSHGIAGIDRVFIAGGTGLERRLADELSRRSASMHCQLLDPAGSVKLPDGENASAFSAAIGLAISQAADGELPFDFVNPKRPVVRRDMKKIRLAAKIGAAAALLIALFVANAMYIDGKKEEIKRQANVLENLKKENKAREAAVTRTRAIEAWTRTGRGWLDQLATLSALLPDARQGYLLGMGFSVNTDTRNTVIDFRIRLRDGKTIDKMNEDLIAAGFMFKPAGHNQIADEHGYTIEQPVTLTIPASSATATGPTSAAATASADALVSLRPADDMSGDDFSKRKGGAKPPERAPVPAASAGPPAAVPANVGANPDYREVGFDGLKRGTQGIDAFKDTPITVRGRVAENVDRYMLDNAQGDKYVGIKLAEGGKGAKRYIYVYVAKNSPLLAELQKRQIPGNAGGRFIKLAGRAYFANNMPDECPVCIIAEKVVQ